MRKEASESQARNNLDEACNMNDEASSSNAGSEAAQSTSGKKGIALWKLLEKSEQHEGRSELTEWRKEASENQNGNMGEACSMDDEASSGNAGSEAGQSTSGKKELALWKLLKNSEQQRGTVTGSGDAAHSDRQTGRLKRKRLEK